MTSLNYNLHPLTSESESFELMDQLNLNGIPVVMTYNTERILSYFRNENGNFFCSNDFRADKQPLFIEKIATISTKSNNDPIAQAMLAKARSNEWNQINVSGTTLFINRVEKHALQFKITVCKKTPFDHDQPLYLPRSTSNQALPTFSNIIENALSDQSKRALAPAQEALAQKELFKFEAAFHNKFPEGRSPPSIARWNSASEYKLREIREKILKENAQHLQCNVEPLIDTTQPSTANVGQIQSASTKKKISHLWKKRLGLNTPKKSPQSNELTPKNQSK
jgi:hypothetical protein